MGQSTIEIIEQITYRSCVSKGDQYVPSVVRKGFRARKGETTNADKTNFRKLRHTWQHSGTEF